VVTRVFVFVDANGNETLRSYGPGALVQVGGVKKPQDEVVVGDYLLFGKTLRPVVEVRLIDSEGE
jgi:hypothetical protein